MTQPTGPHPSGPLNAARVESLLAAIDAANSEDPNLLNGRPLALVQGQAASRWLEQLKADASVELRLAVRGHHLRRWELLRADFPEGRQGYLRWRRENKAHQADSLAALMEADAWPAESIDTVRLLLGRTKLRTDAATQTLEDAACLVFLETQFDEMAERTEHDHLVAIVSKTLKKMSPHAITLAGSIGLTTRAQAVLAEAASTLQS